MDGQTRNHDIDEQSSSLPRTGDQATELLPQHGRSLSISDALSGMSRNEQKAVFATVRSKGDLDYLGFQVDRLFRFVDSDKNGFISDDELNVASKNGALSAPDRTLVKGLRAHASDL